MKHDDTVQRRLAWAIGILTLGILSAGCGEGRFWSRGPTADPFSAAVAHNGKEKDYHNLPPTSQSQDPTVKGPLSLARLSERRGQTDQAEHLYQMIIVRDPTNPVPHHRLAVLCAKQGKFADADEHFAEALRLSPPNPRLMSDIGYSHYIQHRLDDAQSILRHALELTPGDAAITNNLAIVLGEQGRYSESLALFRRVGNEQQAYANVAFVYSQRGDIAEAKAWYGRALSVDDTMRPAAEALIQLTRYEQRDESPPPRGPVTAPVATRAIASLPAPNVRPVAFDQPDRPMIQLGRPMSLTGVPE